MRKFLTAVIVIPLAVLFVVFAVANRHFVTVSFNPFDPSDPSLSASMPLFALIIAVGILGVVAGGCATWIGQRRWRRAARRHQAEAQAARTELANFKAATLTAQGTAQRLPAPAAPASLYGPYGRDKQSAAL
jgi:uncharacterized integral membrane protein